jgi:hypothetical protein
VASFAAPVWAVACDGDTPACAAQAAYADGLSAKESRVVSWSVERILALAGSDASVIDITPRASPPGQASM